MSKVILVDPPYGAKHSRPQLGTMILAAMLRQRGVDSLILDFTVDPRAEERLKAASLQAEAEKLLMTKSQDEIMDRVFQLTQVQPGSDY